MNIKSVDELFHFLTYDFKKVHIFAKGLRRDIYNNSIATI